MRRRGEGLTVLLGPDVLTVGAVVKAAGESYRRARVKPKDVARYVWIGVGLREDVSQLVIARLVFVGGRYKLSKLASEGRTHKGLVQAVVIPAVKAFGLGNGNGRFHLGNGACTRKCRGGQYDCYRNDQCAENFQLFLKVDVHLLFLLFFSSLDLHQGIIIKFIIYVKPLLVKF